MERPSVSALLSVIPLSIWLGASALAAFFVAPAAFASFATRAQAGEFVGRILTPVFAACVLAALLSVLGSWSGGHLRTWRLASSGLLVAIGIASIGIRVKIAGLREAMGPVDAIDAGDPRRILFGRLHGVSVSVFLLGMVVAAIAVALAARDRASESVPSLTASSADSAR